MEVKLVANYVLMLSLNAFYEYLDNYSNTSYEIVQPMLFMLFYDSTMGCDKVKL